MRTESGRSLIEMLGVLAVAGLVSLGAIKMYRSAATRQNRFVAEQELRDLAENTKIIYSGRRNYTGVSKSYLIKTGALKTEKIDGYDFKVRAGEDGKTFSIVFDGMGYGDCAYFATKKFDWADGIAVNGFADQPATLCAELHPNRLEFIVR